MLAYSTQTLRSFALMVFIRLRLISTITLSRLSDESELYRGRWKSCGEIYRNGRMVRYRNYWQSNKV